MGPEPDVIEVGKFGVIVTPICSGADGLRLVVLLQATWIALARERLFFRRAVLLIPLGMALAVVANVIRLATERRRRGRRARRARSRFSDMNQGLESAQANA